MENKRYSIVRVNGTCPFYRELVTTKCWIYKNDKSCFKCKIKNNYGDTKGQMIMKVAQVLLREELEWHRKNLNIIPKWEIDELLVRNLYEHCLDKAKKIVEFLGVE